MYINCLKLCLLSCWLSRWHTGVLVTWDGGQRSAEWLSFLLTRLFALFVLLATLLTVTQIHARQYINKYHENMWARRTCCKGKQHVIQTGSNMCPDSLWQHKILQDAVKYKKTKTNALQVDEDCRQNTKANWRRHCIRLWDQISQRFRILMTKDNNDVHFVSLLNDDKCFFTEKVLINRPDSMKLCSH